MHLKQYKQEATTPGQASMDDSFFKELAENLGIITKVKYVFIAQCQREVTPDCVDTIAFWSKGKIIDNIRYALHGTPCEDVLKGNIRIYSERLQALFPEDEGLQTLEAEGYLGCPIFSSSGNILGHIAILNTIPLENERELIAIIKAFASMARSEFERNQANEINKIILENSLDAFIAINTKGKITNWNKQAKKIFGWCEKEVLGNELYKFIVPRGQKTAHKNGIKRIMKTGKSKISNQRIEITAQHRDGYTFPVELTITPIYSGNEIVSFSAFIRDLTEREKQKALLHTSEEKFSMALEVSPDAVVITRLADGKILEVNDACTRLTRYQRHELIGKTTLELNMYGVDDRKNIVSRLKKEGKYINLESILRRKDGKVLNTLSSAVLIEMKGESCIFGIVHDITKRKKREIALKESENRFRALYDANPAMFFTLNRDNMIVSVNEFGAEKLGYRVEELIGRSKMDMILYEDIDTYRNNIETCFLDSKNTHNWEIRKVKNNGSIIWSKETARLVVDIDETKKLLVVSEDITEAHKLSQQLSYQASHDALTGLVNRREFEIRLERLIHESEGSGEEHALCYLDLDQFKVINDTCGHLAGDELLRQLGELFKSKVRKKDTLARLGGDEFAVLMENCSLKQAQRVANDLRELVEEFHFVWIDKRFSIGASIGLVPIDDSGDNTATDILSAADASCYAAKDAGRNRVHIYHPEDIDLAIHRGQMQWVSRIEHALEEDRFCLYLQPIVSLSEEDEDKKHFECLIRMIDENGKIILPGAFLPAAERYDLSTKIDRWVFESTYAWLEKRSGKSKGLTFCSINLSGHSLSNEEFLQFIVKKLDDGNVLPSNICFEITETVAISRLSNAIRFMEVLKNKGCFFALDDFGSGVSSFGYLKNLAVDYLKIDGMFVRDMVHDPIDLEMVRSINEIGHVMGKKTIAEFVENKEILGRLKELGVDYAQGYHMGKPKAVKIPVLKASDRKRSKKKASKKRRFARTRKTD
jgi:diguanylate cyclase (GGDEF)-like protein/PAS domain S-box-containing protein